MRRVTATGQKVVGLLHALPAVVAIHGVVATADTGDLSDADACQFAADLVDKVDTGKRSGVASVGEQVQVDVLFILLPAQFDAGVEMLQASVHAGVGGDPEQVDSVCVVDRFEQGGVLEKLAAADGPGDAYRFLIDDTAGAEILMADLAVTHGAVGQAHVFAAGFDQGPGVVAQQRVADGRGGQFDGVERIVLGIGISTPTVTNDQHQRSGCMVG